MRMYDCNRILRGNKYNSLKEELSACLDQCGVKAFGFNTPRGRRGVYFYVDSLDTERFRNEFTGDQCIKGPEHWFFFTRISENKYFASSKIIRFEYA